MKKALMLVLLVFLLFLTVSPSVAACVNHPNSSCNCDCGTRTWHQLWREIVYKEYTYVVIGVEG